MELLQNAKAQPSQTISSLNRLCETDFILSPQAAPNSSNINNHAGLNIYWEN